MKSPCHLMRLARLGAGHRTWYNDALQNIMTLCYRKNWGVVRYIEVLALTSPRVSVKRNVSLATEYMTTGQLGPDVLRGTRAALAHYEATGEIRGPKTAAFARALAGDHDAVVLDVWMARALDVDQRKFETKRVRHSAERRVRYAAHLLGWSPAETQAAVWSGTLQRAGRKVPLVQMLEEINK